MIAEYIDDYNVNNIIICEPIKNSIMQYSNFYKLLYSNDLLILNGVYIIFKLNTKNILKDKVYYDLNVNYEILNKLYIIENNILNIINNKKNKIFKLKELFENGFIKFSYSDYDTSNFNLNKNIKNINNNNNNNNLNYFVLKVSGLWENKENIGLTFKIIYFNHYIEFYSPVE